MASKPSARWPIHSLMRSLRLSGWGELSGRENHGLRATLEAVCALVNDEKGEDKATARQVEEASGYSERWTRVKLHELEDMGLLTWVRGGVLNGRTVPGWFRVSKKALVKLINKAKIMLRRRRRVAAEAQAERIRGLGRSFKTRQEQKPSSDHAAVDADLSPTNVGIFESHTLDESLSAQARLDISRRVNEAAINAHHDVQAGLFEGVGVDSRPMATARGGGDGLSARERALAGMGNQALARKMRERAEAGKRERAARRARYGWGA